MSIRDKINLFNENEIKNSEHDTRTESAQNETSVSKTSGDTSQESHLVTSNVENDCIDSVVTSENQEVSKVYFFGILYFCLIFLMNVVGI